MRIRDRRPRMKKMDSLPINLGNKLWEVIQVGFLLAPVERMPPVRRQFFQVIDRNTSAPVIGGKLGRPAGVVKALMQIRKGGLGYLEREWLYVLHG